MPNPNDFKDESAFMTVCVPTVMKEGKKREQAVAQCLGMWRNRNKTQKAANLAGNYIYPEEDET